MHLFAAELTFPDHRWPELYALSQMSFHSANIYIYMYIYGIKTFYVLGRISDVNSDCVLYS